MAWEKEFLIEHLEENPGNDHRNDEAGKGVEILDLFKMELGQFGLEEDEGAEEVGRNDALDGGGGDDVDEAVLRLVGVEVDESDDVVGELRVPSLADLMQEIEGEDHELEVKSQYYELRGNLRVAVVFVVEDADFEQVFLESGINDK